MGRPSVPLDLTLNDLDRSIEGHSHFEALYLVKERIKIKSVLRPVQWHHHI